LIPPDAIFWLATNSNRFQFSATAVLIHVYARCIDNGTNELETSSNELAETMECSRDAIRVAARQLSQTGEIGITMGAKGIKWTLPKHWFSPQISLQFPVENFPERMENQAQVVGKTHRKRQENQAQLIQAVGIPGTSGWKTRHNSKKHIRNARMRHARTTTYLRYVFLTE